ncbi:hypothetical protein FB548_2569 [Pseudoxanthomonas sp. 3HH-4]|uniref:bpX6 domain-containing protein n=1 Tax=Pseudoxanthomonas sp. 3HH-4 TaxID=1690214 RepID=UPI001154E6E3|nr:bpX6 domain-containing protein [Pseudoxanthomonas sp. 3HH-4]TQM10368.1 hypothetical protein FB548_2569 [Pseudoxanthomonas sp. 3HH-4]
MADPLASNIRHPVWQGVQEIAALWFPAEWLGETERELRMIDAWQAGSRAWRFELGDVLVLPRAITGACEGLPGLPLRRIGGVLLSAPLLARETEGLPAHDLVLVRGAQPVALHLSQARAIDLSRHLDVGDYALHDTYDCRMPPAASAGASKLDGASVRKLVGHRIPPLSKEGEAFLAGRMEGEGNGPGAAKQRFGRAVGTVLGTMLKVVPFIGAGLATISRSDGAGDGLVQPRGKPAQPGRLRAAIARIALATRLSALVGYQQGAYLKRLMSMFDRGDLEEALRNALPIDSLAQSLGQSFSQPGRRNDLRLSGGAGGGLSIGLGPDLQDHLRGLYRRAFESFDRQGRIDEAVFVLAELLNARQEALDYLVRHERHAQAAELALGWEMPAAAIIRLLMLAGDVQRAVLVARRDGAFAAAIQMLQGTHAELADRLRSEWGHALVAQGDWLGAVEAVWTLPAMRAQATEWLLAAERAGGELGARALVQRAVLLPDTLEQYAGLIELLADPWTGADARTAMAQAMLSVAGKSEALRMMAARLLPAVAADCAASRNGFGTKDLENLLALSGDGCLKADAPGWALGPRESTPFWSQARALLLEAPAPGLQAIHDAIPLPGRQTLVALGEAGAVVIDAAGKVRQRYATPAYFLVASPLGRVALAVAPRERVSSIARLDLVGHAITDLGALALRFPSPRFDGIGWSVICDQRVLVIDTHSAAREVLWHIGDLGGPIVAAGHFASRETFLVRGSDAQLRDWSYGLPSRRRLSCGDAPLDPEAPVYIHPSRGMFQPSVVLGAEDVTLEYRLGGGMIRAALCPMDEGQECLNSSIQVLEAGLVVGLTFATRIEFFFCGLDGTRVVARVSWPAESPPSVREQDGQILMFDGEGRLLHLDLATSARRHLSVR